MSFVYRVVLFAGPWIALVLAGCKPPWEHEKVPGSVPIKIWVVLSPFDTGMAAPIEGGPTVCESDNRTPCTEANVKTNCQPGDKCIVKHSGRQNIGCRLSQDEIKVIVEELYKHQCLLGGLNLQPAVGSIATVIKDIEEPSLSTRMHQADAFDEFADSCLRATPRCWEPDHLNIYFTGHVIDGTNFFSASTTDPREAAGLPPFILMNDGGWVLDEGFAHGDHYDPPQPAGDQPSAVATYGTLTHEVVHYFISRNGCWPYYANEHVPASYDHIMNDAILPLPKPIKFRPSEAWEIQCRHESGSWTLHDDDCTPDPCP